MDRVQNYNLQTPLTADDLNKERDYTAIALGKIVSALLGQGTVVSDLAATAVASTTVPTLQLSDGQLYELATLDPTAFGSLPVNSFPSIATVMKQGLLLASRGDANTFELTPPGTSGESIIYLLEAQYADLDADTQTITFYNVSDPTNPTTATQPRVREGTISFVLKAGIASSSPTAPSADAGYVPLYNIEVAYGQTVLSQSNITVASGAPFLTQKLFNFMNESGGITVPAIAGNPSFSGGLTVPIGQPQTGIIYDIVGGVSGPIAANQYVLFFKAIRAVNVPANMGNSTAQVNTAFTSAATFVVYHNGVVEASLLFSAGGTIGTFTTSSAFTLAVGDILLIQAPGTADATANTLAITIEATLA